MKKTMTMALALVGIVGFVLAGDDAFRIETAPAGYLEKTGSGQIWSSSTFLTFEGSENLMLGDIGVKEDAFIFGQDSIKVFDNAGALKLEASYDKDAEVPGWYAKEKGKSWTQTTLTLANDFALKFGDAICFVPANEGAALVYSGLLKSGATTLNAEKNTQAWIGNVNPVVAELPLGSVVASNFVAQVDYLQIYDANGALLHKLTYDNGWYKMVEETKTVRGKTVKSYKIGTECQNDIIKLSPGQGFVVLPASGNVSLTFPGLPGSSAN